MKDGSASTGKNENLKDAAEAALGTAGDPSLPRGSCDKNGAGAPKNLSGASFRAGVQSSMEG